MIEWIALAISVVGFVLSAWRWGKQQALRHEVDSLLTGALNLAAASEAHGRTLAAHTERLDSHAGFWNLHKARLTEHGSTLTAYGHSLDRDAERLDRCESRIGAVERGLVVQGEGGPGGVGTPGAQVATGGNGGGGYAGACSSTVRKVPMPPLVEQREPGTGKPVVRTAAEVLGCEGCGATTFQPHRDDCPSLQVAGKVLP